MFTLLYKWIVSIFTKDSIGLIVRKLLLSATKPILKDLFNVEYQKKAYEYVKELDARDDLSNLEKAKLFNEKFLRFLKTGAKEISKSMLNCLREMALAAYKSDLEEANSAEEKD